jgi:hypothetical protein
MEHTKFTTLREDFNEYHVENGQILKMKIILVDITVQTGENGQKRSNLALKYFSHIITDIHIDTTNLEYASEEQVTEKDEIKELWFQSIKEVVNIYETQKNLILISPILRRVMLTNKKDKEGAPILRIGYEAAINAIDKSSLYQPSAASPNVRSS